MAISIPLKQMSVQEKMLAMEALWDDLCGQAEAELSPEWHGELLAGREQAVAEGQDSFSDWTEAKERLRKQLL